MSVKFDFSVLSFRRFTYYFCFGVNKMGDPSIRIVPKQTSPSAIGINVIFQNKIILKMVTKKIWPTFGEALMYNLILACAHPFAGDWRLVVPFSVNFPDWPFGVGSAARHRTSNCSECSPDPKHLFSSLFLFQVGARTVLALATTTSHKLYSRSWQTRSTQNLE